MNELAERLSGPGVRRGREIAFRCPLHDDHDPSMRTDPEKGVWYCDPCAVGGDVVRLARLAWNIERDDVAAAEVLLAFGHEIPERRPEWFGRQERQRSVRDDIERERIEHVRLLVFRLIWVPWLKTLPEWIREEAESSAWAESRTMATRIYASRMDAGREES